MDEFLQIYKQTWWFWLLTVIISIVLARTISGVGFVFYLLIPILLGYSVYFAYVRGSEMRARNDEEDERQRRLKQQQEKAPS